MLIMLINFAQNQPECPFSFCNPPSLPSHPYLLPRVYYPSAKVITPTRQRGLIMQPSHRDISRRGSSIGRAVPSYTDPLIAFRLTCIVWSNYWLKSWTWQRSWFNPKSLHFDNLFGHRCIVYLQPLLFEHCSRWSSLIIMLMRECRTKMGSTARFQYLRVGAPLLPPAV